MPHASEWRAQARKHWDAGALDRAEDCLAMALEADPTPTERVWILLSLALLCREGGRAGEATGYIEQAAEQERDPLALGLALYEGGDFALSASLFAEAARRGSAGAQPLRMLGAARAASGDLAGAARAYEEAIARDITDHSLRHDLALALYHAGDLPRAVNQLHILLQAAPKHREARLLKAAIAFEQRQYREAAADYEALIRTGAGPDVYEALATAYVQAGEQLKAARALADCTEAHPTHWVAYRLAARLFEAAGQFARARRFYDAAGYLGEGREEALTAHERLAGREDATPRPLTVGLRPPLAPSSPSPRGEI